MHGSESFLAIDQKCSIPNPTCPSRVVEYQKQQRTLEYLLQMSRHKRCDKISSNEFLGHETIHASLSNNSNNDLMSANLVNTLCQEFDKSGDWKDNDFWKPQAHPPQKALSHEINAAELKYRNLYSMSNSNRYGGWDTGNIDITESLQGELAKDGEQNILFNIRDYLARGQEIHGTPRTDYTFAALISLMGQSTGRSLLALFYIIVNIAPVAEVFLYILRFILDKVINIMNTSDRQQIIVKYLILGLQLLIIYIYLVFIFGFIITPIVYMVIEILTKIMLFS